MATFGRPAPSCTGVYGPLILAPNHPSLIDAIVILSHHPNLSCVMKADLMGNILLGPGARLARFMHNGSPRQMVREAGADVRRGGLVLLFPEGMVKLNASAGEILRRCDGVRTTGQIITELETAFETKNLGPDVDAFLEHAVSRGWVES